MNEALDGVFETLCIRNGIPWQAHRHEARMRKGAALMGTPFPTDAWSEALVQEGDRMLRIDLHRDGHWATATRPLVPHPSAPIAVITSTERITCQPWSGAKPRHMPAHAAARREAQQQGADDALLVCGSMVAEATTANVIAWIDGTCFAPGAASGAVDGVARQVLMPGGAIEPLPLDRLPEVDAMALTNVRGVRIVGTLDGRPLDPGPGTAIRAAYEAAC